MLSFFSPFYCGVILVIVGIFALIRALFGVTIPLVRIGFGVLLTYAGICALMGPIPTNDSERKTFIFEQSVINQHNHHSYNTLFGQTTIDLSTFAVPKEKRTIEINNLFGMVDIILNPDIPTRISVERAFGNIRIANEDIAGHSLLPLPSLFGACQYDTHHEAPLLEIKSRNVFGTISAYISPLVPSTSTELAKELTVHS